MECAGRWTKSNDCTMLTNKLWSGMSSTSSTEINNVVMWRGQATDCASSWHKHMLLHQYTIPYYLQWAKMLQNVDEMSAQATESTALVANGNQPQTHAMLLKGHKERWQTFWDKKRILLQSSWTVGQQQLLHNTVAPEGSQRKKTARFPHKENDPSPWRWPYTVCVITLILKQFP